MQEVNTRFGTTHEITERFMKVFVQVGDIIARKGHREASEAYHAIFVLRCDQLPMLEAIIDVFGPIRHKQTAMEAANEPTMHKMLAMLVQRKCQIDSLRRG